MKVHFETPDAVEQAFYSAYENADIVGMRSVWAGDESIECIHPLGARQRGEAVHKGWQDVFVHGERVAFHVHDRRVFGHAGLTVHLVVQDILFADAKAEPLRILATNVYRHEPAEGWRMVLHHASPAPIANPLHPSGTARH